MRRGAQQLWICTPACWRKDPGLARLIARVELALEIQRLLEGIKSSLGDGLGLFSLHCSFSVSSESDPCEHQRLGFSVSWAGVS